MHDRLGLALMDRMPWVNFSKPPGPTYWACVNRVQLTTAYEPVFWFTNDPERVRSDNRRVLEAHTDRHTRLMHAGGAQRTATYGDGAYKIRPDSYGRVTGKNPPKRNPARQRLQRYTRLSGARSALGLPPHGAMYPTSIPDFFIRFLTEPGELVVDTFAVPSNGSRGRAPGPPLVCHRMDPRILARCGRVISQSLRLRYESRAVGGARRFCIMNASFAHLPFRGVALNIPALERDGDMEAGEPV